MGWITLEKQRAYYHTHKKYWQDYYKRKRDEIRVKANKRYELDGSNDRKRMHRLVGDHKRTVLTHYGNGRCACVKCGFDDSRALGIDHMTGGGNKHKEKLRRMGKAFYRWLIENHYPPGYQTLCMNCNWIKRFTDNECHRKEP